MVEDSVVKPDNVVFVAYPYYGAPPEVGTMTTPATGGELKLNRHYVSSSLLSKTFTLPWVNAILGGYQYFAMLHSDIVPEHQWLDKLMRELREHNADVMSAIVPIKCDPTPHCSWCGKECGADTCECGGEAVPEQYTSTAYWVDGEWVRRRLTLEQAHRYGEKTFSDYNGHPLLVNTGCWLAKFGEYAGREPDEPIATWFARTPRDQWPWQAMDGRGFELLMDVDWENGGRMRSHSEDWLMSERVRELGAKVFATLAVSVAHLGKDYWTNQVVDTNGQVPAEASLDAGAQPA